METLYFVSQAVRLQRAHVAVEGIPKTEPRAMVGYGLQSTYSSWRKDDQETTATQRVGRMRGNRLLLLLTLEASFSPELALLGFVFVFQSYHYISLFMAVVNIPMSLYNFFQRIGSIYDSLKKFRFD